MHTHAHTHLLCQIYKTTVIHSWHIWLVLRQQGGLFSWHLVCCISDKAGYAWINTHHPHTHACTHTHLLYTTTHTHRQLHTHIHTYIHMHTHLLRQIYKTTVMRYCFACKLRFEVVWQPLFSLFLVRSLLERGLRFTFTQKALVPTSPRSPWGSLGNLWWVKTYTFIHFTTYASTVTQGYNSNPWIH